MKIVLDTEGVLMNMLDAIKKRDPRFVPRGVTDYGFKTPGYGILREDVFRYLSEKRTFELEQPYKGAKEGVNQLQSLGTVIGWTTVPEDVVELRRHQLYKLGIRKFSIHSGDKPIIKDADVVIDDSPEELEKYKDKDCIRIIIDRYYNREYKDAIRCKNVLEAAQTVKKIMKTLKKV